MIAIYSDASAVADAAAATVLDEVADGSVRTLGLAGGSTPSVTYERLRAANVDWSGVTLWLGDERWVTADDPEANAGMVRRTLGDDVPLIAPDFSLGDPEVAAGVYAHDLTLAFAVGDGRPDLVLLGMGDDGHTASLFPGTDALDIMDRDYVANWVSAKNTWRLTATFPLLWSARHVLFIITGEAKAAVIGRILEGHEPLPAQRVAAGAEQVTWMLDEAAASQRRTTPM